MTKHNAKKKGGYFCHSDYKKHVLEVRQKSFLVGLFMQLAFLLSSRVSETLRLRKNNFVISKRKIILRNFKRDKGSRGTNHIIKDLDIVHHVQSLTQKDSKLFPFSRQYVQVYESYTMRQDILHIVTGFFTIFIEFFFFRNNILFSFLNYKKSHTSFLLY